MGPGTAAPAVLAAALLLAACGSEGQEQVTDVSPAEVARETVQKTWKSSTATEQTRWCSRYFADSPNVYDAVLYGQDPQANGYDAVLADTWTAYLETHCTP